MNMMPYLFFARTHARSLCEHPKFWRVRACVHTLIALDDDGMPRLCHFVQLKKWTSMDVCHFCARRIFEGECERVKDHASTVEHMVSWNDYFIMYFCMFFFSFKTFYSISYFLFLVKKFLFMYHGYHFVFLVLFQLIFYGIFVKNFAWK